MDVWQRKIIAIVLCLVCLFSVYGCELFEGDDPIIVIDPDNNGGEIDMDNIEINLPQASGTVVYRENGFVIDASNTDDGYVMVKHNGTTKKLKVKIFLGDQSYTYDLFDTGDFEVFPLQMGNGEYRIKIYEYVQGSSYALVCSESFDVSMDNANRVFVFPNQYVWYTNANDAIALSYEICANADDNEDKADIIYKYVNRHIDYDSEKAETVQVGYLPNVDETLRTKKGICFDYAALMAAMLRAQDIPTRLVIGYVGPEGYYHAWNQVYLNGKWVWMDPTFGSWSGHKESDYTGERKY